MNKKTLLSLLTTACMAVAGCGATNETASGTSLSGTGTSVTGIVAEASSSLNVSGASASVADTTPTLIADVTPLLTTDASENLQAVSGSFSITSEDGKFTKDGNTYTITSAGTYTLSGLLEEGCLIVDAGDDDKVNLDLAGVKITSSTTSPILLLNADKVKIKSVEGTYNEITDSRAEKNADESDGDANAAIYAKCDLDLTGKGTLVVSSTYNNGIQSKDSVSVKNVTLKITAANNALRGNDSVDIESGNLILIAKGGDGIKTSNTDISSKGNQRGTVTISGGNVDIYACCNGIDAAYDAVITTDGNINIFTDKYSEYASGKVESGSDFYIVVPTSVYTSTTTFYAYFYNDDYSAGVWREASYDSMVSSGRTRYYCLKMSAPSGYTNVQFFKFKNGTEPNTDSFVAATKCDTFNTAKNAFVITSADTSTQLMSGDYNQITVNMGGNSGKSVYSTKGITASDSVTVANAVITIKCSDDGIHANNDDLLDTNVYGIGDVTIESGTITITAADDGIHADNILNINGGTLNILTAYEGIEGNVVNINGGNNFIYATDDGINACSGNTTPLISFNGGYTDITTPSGDTDAVDSNGNITVTGGYVLVKGGNSSGNMAGSVDADGKITVTGGTIIALGGICEVPTNSVNGYVASGTSFESGSYELKDASGNTIASFTLSAGYRNGWLSSDKLATGTAYTLYKDGASVLSWTQESGTMNASSASGFGGFGGGPGGFGGFGGGGRR